MELKQLVWASDPMIEPGMPALAAQSSDLWSSNLVEGLKAWIESPAEPLVGASGDSSEALAVIDSAFQAVRSALLTYA
jgi:hypothetical protein